MALFQHMTPVHVERLFDLATHLRTVESKKFNFGQWCRKEKGCGTVACVLGHAGLMPKFRKLGLKSNASTDDVEFNPVTNMDKESVARVLSDTLCSTSDNSKRGAAFFGLTASEAYELFIIGGVYDGDTVTTKKAADVLMAICKLQSPQLFKELKAKAKAKAK